MNIHCELRRISHEQIMNQLRLNCGFLLLQRSNQKSDGNPEPLDLPGKKDLARRAKTVTSKSMSAQEESAAARAVTAARAHVALTDRLARFDGRAGCSSSFRRVERGEAGATRGFALTPSSPWRRSRCERRETHRLLSLRRF